MNKKIENESTPLFEEAVNHVQVNELSSDENEDRYKYDRYIELNSLKDSLTSHNYKHYYIHLDDSLDKLIEEQRLILNLNKKIRLLIIVIMSHNIVTSLLHQIKILSVH